MQKKKSDDMNNLRPVSISDAYANIYETILLHETNKYHKDNNKQFGFKKSSSCSHAIFMLKQSIIKAATDGKRLYVAAIDASKAFDKVNRDILWCKLIDLKINSRIVSALKNYYDNSIMLCSNDGES